MLMAQARSGPGWPNLRTKERSVFRRQQPGGFTWVTDVVMEDQVMGVAEAGPIPVVVATARAQGRRLHGQHPAVILEEAATAFEPAPTIPDTSSSGTPKLADGNTPTDELPKRNSGGPSGVGMRFTTSMVTKGITSHPTCKSSKKKSTGGFIKNESSYYRFSLAKGGPTGFGPLFLFEPNGNLRRRHLYWH
jgi:hypothetical protein